MAVLCPTAHTEPQPEPGLMDCPKCFGKKVVFIEESDDSINPDCERLHPEDELRCGDCHHGCSGQQYADWLKRMLRLTMT
jgi:hypothetical protein